MASAMRIDVPKDATSYRPGLILDAVDRVAYQALVDALVPTLLPNIPEWVCGWRPTREVNNRRLYAHEGAEWHLLQRRLDSGLANHKHALRIDIAHFFHSVPLQLLFRRVFDALDAGLRPLLPKLEGMIAAWSEIPSRKGLPQRTKASSMLAQFYLRPLDGLLARRTKRAGLSACRWMDDVWLFSSDKVRLERMRDEIGALFLELGLEVNSSKTRLIDSQDSIALRLLRRVSGIERLLAADAVDLARGELSKLTVESFANQSEVPIAVWRFIASRSERLKESVLVETLGTKLGSIPHAADTVSRCLRRTEAWRPCEEWFVSTAREGQGSYYGELQSWALMFPTSYGPDGPVAEYFARDVLAAPREPLLVPAAVMRTIQWRGRDALPAIVEAGEAVESPFERRAVALGMAACSRDATDSVKLLGSPEHECLRAVLREGRDLIRSGPDFS
ncbi:MAG: reverse transcriptase domain-containing protein [Acidobacteriota bacterium]